jgi:hypothetical protein
VRGRTARADIGRALVATGLYDRAAQRIVRAARVAPQMTAYHPMARETAAMLADHYRVLPEPLRALLDRMGLI